METVTLIHNRWPKDEFIHEVGTGETIDDIDDFTDAERGALYRTPGRPLGKPVNRKRISGMWGTMMMAIGGPIRIARLTQLAPDQLLDGEEQVELSVNNRTIYAAVKGAITSKKLFTTIERYRTDDGRVNEYDFGYVRLMGRDAPYDLRIEPNNTEVKKLRRGHDGICIRVLGGTSVQQRAILIHEAPHVGWVTGCIGPRPLGDREVYDNVPGNPADRTVREIIGELRRHGGKGSLFVMPR